MRDAGVHIGTRLNGSEDASDIAALYDRWLNAWLLDSASVEGDLLDDLAGVLREHVADLREPAPWGWKAPRSLYLLPLLASTFPALRFFHVIRDGRDMALSSNQHQLRKHGAAVLADDSDELTPRRSLALWARVNDEAATQGETLLGARYLRVRFEDLCADPVGEVERIVRWVGADADADAERLAALVEAPPTIGRGRDAGVPAGPEAAAALARFGYA